MTDLRKIGLEGFYLIEKCHGGGQGGQRGRRGFQAVEAAAPRRQGRRVDHDMETEPSCINSREAASIYGGINVVNYTTTSASSSSSSKGHPQTSHRWGKSYYGNKN